MAAETATDPVRPPDGGPCAVAPLPPDPVPFVGRRSELAALRAEIPVPGPAVVPGAGHCRVLVVAGRAGSGRTSLAVRFARTAAADYPDGQFFVRLGSCEGRPALPGPAARQLLTALGRPPAEAGLPDPSAEPDADPACAALRHALTGKRVLLVLDDVQDAAQLRPLLPEEPGCLVVVTAAGPLTGIADARPCILGGLDPAAAVALLTGLVGETRIVCDPVGAAELAEACGCHPAALRLVAGWLRTRPRVAVPEAVQALAEPLLAGPPSAERQERPPAPPGVSKPQGTAGAGESDLLALWEAFRSSPTGRRPQPVPPPPAATAADVDALSLWEAVRGSAGGGSEVRGSAGGGGAREGSRDRSAAADAGPAQQPDAGPAARQKAAAGAAEGAADASGTPRADAGGTPPSTDRAADVARSAPPRASVRPNGPTRSGRAVIAAMALPLTGAVQAPSPGASPDPMHRAFALLHRGLPPTHARMLRLLALAPLGAADRRTASALAGCPADSAEHILRMLAEQQLLDEQPAAPDGTLRYRLPSRLHALITGLLPDSERPAEIQLARARLLERLLRLVDSCRALLAPEPGAAAPEPLPGPLRLRSAAQARDWLVLEQPVLRLAVRGAVRAGDLDSQAGRLAAALVRTLPVAGVAPPAVLLELHGLVLEVARRTAAPAREAAARINLGDLLAAAGEHGRALEHYRAAPAAARAAEDEAALARALEAVAGTHRALGDPVRSADWYARAIAVRRSRGEQRAEARLTARLAEARAGQQRLEEAVREYRAALLLLRRLGDDAAQVAVLLETARVLLRAGQAEQALRTHREALVAARRAADPLLEARALEALGRVLDLTGDPEGARLHLEQAARMSDLG
ncbi:tetratricopeptide repeat protein [Peterkaempfera sp. SMS 1(5)a]|uniref:tetratricopeptide repeat protein n=1 Tax=Peterkaempfera podocarpi TaxID=3232308 RepID=UPI00367153ED